MQSDTQEHITLDEMIRSCLFCQVIACEILLFYFMYDMNSFIQSLFCMPGKKLDSNEKKKKKKNYARISIT